MAAHDPPRTFSKRRADAPPDFFAAEARGLAALRAAGGLRVPGVFVVERERIVLEDLGHGTPAADFWIRAAEGLARQHRTRASGFGFGHPGYCGDSPQDNTPDDDGWRFFAERRLLPHLRRARDQDLLAADDAARVERVCARLRQRIPVMAPTLLHGDLWLGNLHACANGEPALIDAAAVHYGWAEAELAMLTLFGSPPAVFFETYAAHAPLRRDWRERAPIYNLHHLLNHVNLFGKGYVPMLRAALVGEERRVR